MVEITKDLFIGNQQDYESVVRYQPGWYVIHACKEPYHRQALGYIGRAASKDDPEYLMAFRENCLILNLVDVDNINFISSDIIKTALKSIDNNIPTKKVLVHCNQGQSRSAIIGLLYLAQKGILTSQSFEEAEKEYEKIYPIYLPANGMRDFAKINWSKYQKT
ncbi:MAG: hypothetical protein ABFD10_03650 [Prolixibacteraceae bacterium]